MLARPTRAFPGTMFYLKGSALLAVLPVIIALVLYAEGVYQLFHHFEQRHLSITTTPFTLVGLALSIFLGFRNNACYDRWWEARKLWGAQINTTRSMARLLLNLVRSEEHADEVRSFQKEMVYRVIAYTHALRLHLRQQLGRMDAEVGPFLPADEMAALHHESNVPNAIAQRMGERVMDAYARGWIHVMHVPTLQDTLTHFLDIQGGCERIKNTPVPLSYTMLTHRIVAVYCAALPFGLVDTVGKATPLVVAIVSFAFLGLDAVGSQIEDPFEEDPNDLPLHQISRMIEINLKQRLGEKELPPAIQPIDGIIL
ncbi:MAG: bestrophin family protein [Myxococcales bacterium]|nr:bestrophin family protein [Myxococcales bacterium]